MNAMSRYHDPARATRRWITFGLAVGGATVGAVFGVGLTALGKIIADAPPADASNYLWNAGCFAAIAALVAPTVTWSALRRVPLWRTVAEPFAGALLGAGIGAALGSGALFLVLPPIGIGAAAFGLARRYREQASSPVMLPETAG